MSEKKSGGGFPLQARTVTLREISSFKSNIGLGEVFKKEKKERRPGLRKKKKK